jgi:uncharacterized protein (DUF302 family)
MNGRSFRYGFGVELACSLEEAIERVTVALKVEGFGELTTIDVKQTLQQTFGVIFEPYTILGVQPATCASRVAG